MVKAKEPAELAELRRVIVERGEEALRPLVKDIAGEKTVDGYIQALNWVLAQLDAIAYRKD